MRRVCSSAGVFCAAVLQLGEVEWADERQGQAFRLLLEQVRDLQALIREDNVA